MASRSIEAGRAFMRLTINDQAFRRGLLGASRRLKAFGRSVAGIGAGFAGIGATLTAPLLSTIRAASDAQETFSKFSVVFGENADAVKSWGNEVASQVGRSQTAVAGFLSGFQDLLVPIGIDPDIAEGSSKQLTQLAIDLASFNNLTDDAAVRDLQAALTGSSEVMKKYGVIVNEAAVKQELLNQGIQPKGASEQEKVFARLNIIMAGTTAAQGDAIRTSGGFANSAKALTGAVFDLGAAIGSALLEPLAKFAQFATNGVRVITAFAKRNALAIQIFAAGAVSVTAFGVALVTLGGAATAVGFALSGLSSIVGTIGATLAVVLSPIGLLTAAAVGLTVAFTDFGDLTSRAIGALQQAFGPLLGIVQTTLKGVQDAMTSGELEAAAAVATTGISAVWKQLTVDMRSTWAAMQGYLTRTWGTAVSALTIAMVQIERGWANVSAFFQNTWATAIYYVTQLVENLTAFISEQIFGKEYNLEVRLNSADEKLLKTLDEIEKSTDRKVEQLLKEQDGALNAIDDSERQRIRELRDELKSSRDAAAEAKRRVEELAAETAKAAKAQRKTAEEIIGGNGSGGVAAALKRASFALREGTLGGRGLSQRGSQTLSVAQEQLEQQKRQAELQADTIAAINKTGLVGV